MPPTKNTQPTPPDSQPVDQLTAAGVSDLQNNADLESTLFNKPTPTPIHAHDITLYQSTIQGQTLTASTLPNARFTDCTFDCADLSAATWIDARIIRTSFTNCKLTGFDARGTDLRDVLFKDCKIPDAFFQDATLTRVRFDNCHLPNLDLSGSTIHSLSIHNSTAPSLRLLATKVTHIDLRASRIDHIALDPANLKAILIDPTQAHEFARALGVQIKGINQ